MTKLLVFIIVVVAAWAGLTGKLAFLSSSDLVKIGTYKTDGGFTVYENSKFVQRKGDRVQMRRIADYETKQNVDGKAFLSFVTFKEYDCRERTSRTIGLATYSQNMAKGELVHSDREAEEWAPVKVGGGSEKALKIACNS